MSMGRTLKALRKMRGLTQAELAARMRLSRTSIANIEAGRQTITVQTLYEFADALGYALKMQFKPNGDWNNEH
jgi:transcriptional regulator with XRE-family HTH domain